MRVVSMVPSWTETLIEASANVVGRTRFCIHPRDRVKAIPAIGGTKNWDVGRLKDLKPDVIVLDREENTAEMGSTREAPVLATHVCSISDVPEELRRLAKELNLPRLNEMAERYQPLLAREPLPISHLPGVIEWVRAPSAKIEAIVYVIWKDPWMAVGRRTFIGSMLELMMGRGMGAELEMKYPDMKYPKIDLHSLDPVTTLCLFSSEPFPFTKHRHELEALPFASAIVDGESWSWFGIRSLRFLETVSR